MKQWKTTLLTILLTLVILCTGVLGSTFVKSMLPMGLNKVEGYDKTLQINPLLSLESAEALILFPWNYYDASKVKPLKTLQDTCAEKTAFYMRDIIQNMSGDAYTFKENLVDNIVYTEDNASFVFIKDFPLENAEANKSYIVSTAFSDLGNCLYYYHLRPKETKEITAEQKIQAKKHIASFVNNTQKEDNPLRQYLYKMLSINLSISPQYMVEHATEISYFSYQDEILLSFTCEPAEEKEHGEEEFIQAALEDDLEEFRHTAPISAAMNSNKTLVLFYNIEENCFSGFAWK